MNRAREVLKEDQSAWPATHASGRGLGKGAQKMLQAGEFVAERVRLLEKGAYLWSSTYVPPIEPVRRQTLIDKWSGKAAQGRNSDQVSTS